MAHDTPSAQAKAALVAIANDAASAAAEAAANPPPPVPPGDRSLGSNRTKPGEVGSTAMGALLMISEGFDPNVRLRREDATVEIEVFGLECAKQLDELMHVRQQYVLALKRQTTTREVYDELKRELDGERSVLRSLERTHRMLSGSQETRDKYGTTDEEVKTIREKLERKEPEVRRSQ